MFLYIYGYIARLYKAVLDKYGRICYNTRYMNRKSRRALKAKGIDVSKSREELNQQYTMLCAEAGDLNFKKEQLREELDKVNGMLTAINSKLKALSQQARATAMTPPAPEAPKETSDVSKETA